MNYFRGVFRCMAHRGAVPQRASSLALLGALLAVSWVAGPSDLKLDAHPQASLQAVADQVTYNVGDTVSLRIVSPSPQADQDQVQYFFTVRYAGEAKPLADGLVLGDSGGPYRLLWKVPLDARAGRYEVGLRAQDSRSHQVVNDIPAICSFVVHRQEIQIVSADVAHSYYTSGDDRWLQREARKPERQPRARTSPRILRTLLAMDRAAEGAGWDGHRNVAKRNHPEAARDDFYQRSPLRTGQEGANQPTIKQYAAVVWDHDRKNVLAIAFTPLVFINPPGVVAPRPYPAQYVYPSLDGGQHHKLSAFSSRALWRGRHSV